MYIVHGIGQVCRNDSCFNALIKDPTFLELIVNVLFNRGSISVDHAIIVVVQY